jgi:ankyrin repeat protein
MRYHLLKSGKHANELYHSYKSFFFENSTVRNNWWKTMKYYESRKQNRFKIMTDIHAPPVLHIASCSSISWMQAILNQEIRKSKRQKTVNERDYWGQSALFYALAFEPTVSFPPLIEAGVNIDAKRSDCYTLLIHCVRWAEHHVAAVIEFGANMEKPMEFIMGDNWNALHMAVMYEREAVVRVLLEKGANIHAKTSSGETALMLAAMFGEWNVAQLLIEKGANIHSRDSYGHTAIILAAKSGHDSVVSYLLDQGAQIDEEDEKQKTALSWAAYGGHESTVRLLINRGANMRHTRPRLTAPLLFFGKDHYGSIALCLAARRCYPGVVELLLERGVDPKSRYESRTAREWAVKGGHDADIFGRKREHKAVVQLLDEALSQTRE